MSSLFPQSPEQPAPDLSTQGAPKSSVQTLEQYQASKPDPTILISDLSHQITVLEEKLEKAHQDIEHWKGNAIRATAARDTLKELLLELMERS